MGFAPDGPVRWRVACDRSSMGQGAGTVLAEWTSGAAERFPTLSDARHGHVAC